MLAAKQAIEVEIILHFVGEGIKPWFEPIIHRAARKKEEDEYGLD